MSARLVQLVAILVIAVGVAGAGALVPRMERTIEDQGLRYTDVSVDGAPPWVALGTAIGALRGLIVDILWIKVHWMKQQGLYYEVMSDAELITKLQPRFASVWAFHGHNMAYNISVATRTLEERWEWVQAGIRLVQNEGLRYNPNDLNLHRELSFWYSHKVEGYADDAHFFYKQKLAEEWHLLLGAPPDSVEDRVAWLEEIASAPGTMSELEAREPRVGELLDRFEAAMSPFGRNEQFGVNRMFLTRYGMWRAIREDSAVAQMLGVEQRMRSESPAFRAFDEIASDPELESAWRMLVAHVRKRVLLDQYNMDPRWMATFTRELGPIDWRHGAAHALYWARLGEVRGSTRYSNQDEIYNALNNDSMQLTSIQALARWGRVNYDPFSGEPPTRFPEPRFIETIEEQFSIYYAKHYDTRGAGGERFIAFLKNFMSSAVREAYRSGEFDRAQRLLDKLNERFGTGRDDHLANPEYALPLEVFVRNQIKGQYEFQPHLAPSEAVASMRAGFRIGVGRDREDVYRNAVTFVNQVITIFKENEYYDYETWAGTERMADLMKDFPTLQREAFLQLMTDTSVPVLEKATIWAAIDSFGRVDPTTRRLRLETYDDMRPRLERQLQTTSVGRQATFDQLFPPPPGLEAYRQRRAAERAREAQKREQGQGDFEQSGSRR